MTENEEVDPMLVAVSAVLAYFYIFGFEWLYHSILLGKIYISPEDYWQHITQSVLRPYSVFGQMILAIAAAMTYSFGFSRAEGWMPAFKFGFYLGSVLCGLKLMGLAYMPAPVEFVPIWMLESFLKSFGLGAIFVVLYRQARNKQTRK